MTSPRISRRTLLRGAGIGGLNAAVGLPWLEAMAPRARAAASAANPMRVGFFYVPNGIQMSDWRLSGAGALGELSPILKPLSSHKDNLIVLTNLAADHCNGNGAAHEPAGGGFLVGSRCKHSEEPEVGNASVDQRIAQHCTGQTPVESLALGIDPGHRGDHGYSGTYMSHISWRSKTSPVPLDLNPKHLYERLYGGKRPTRHVHRDIAGEPDSADAMVLDLVLSDAKSLQRQVGFSDRRKIDEYLEGLYSIERRIRFASSDSHSHHQDSFVEDPNRHDDDPGLETLIIPEGKGIPSVYADHVNLMLDILTVAYQTDTTRVASFLFSYEKSGRSYPELDAPGAHHSTSHHQKKEENLVQLTKVNTHHMELFARMVDRLSKTPEGDGSLLDHTILCYGSGISDGNQHNHDDLPVILVGGKQTGIQGGRHVAFDQKTPICNLYVELMHRMGMSETRFGDNTGRMVELSNIG
jgi:hypothetical protein